MSFTFQTDTNNKAGAVRQNPGGTGFHVTSVLYGKDGVTPSRVRLKKRYNPSHEGSAYIMKPQEEKIFVDNHEFNEGTASWGLSFIEFNRPPSSVLERLKIKVVMSDTPGNFDMITGGHEVTFSKVFDLSELDEVDKGLVIPHHTLSDNGSNILLIGKPFNIPLGKYMQVTLISTYEKSDLHIKGFNIIEEGWF